MRTFKLYARIVILLSIAVAWPLAEFLGSPWHHWYGFLIAGAVGCLTALVSDAAASAIVKAANGTTPKNARFITQLLSATKSGDAFLGDLEERFPKILSEHGPTRAWLWYWFQVVISLRPIAWAALKRGTVLAAAYESIRKIIR